MEITESVAMKDLPHSIRVLKDLNDLGITASLDDFGSGYSSLNYLKQLPLKALKIDRSFIQDMEADRKNGSIASAIITLGHILGLEVIAEGVETDEQLAFLNSQACDAVQGFLFTRPVPGEEFGRMMKNRKLLHVLHRTMPSLMARESASR